MTKSLNNEERSTSIEINTQKHFTFTRRRLLRGNCGLKMKEMDLALSDLKKWVIMISESKNAEILDTELKKLGEELFDMNEFEGAIWFFTEAIRRKPTDVLFRRLRGDCFLKINNWDLAISDFQEALRNNPRNEYDRTRFRRVLFDSGKYQYALEGSFILDDTDFAWLGDELRFANEKLEEALSYYTEAIKRNSKNIEYYGRRGSCFLTLGCYNHAVSDFKQGLQLQPDNMNIWYYLIRTLIRSQRYDEAIKETLLLDNIDFIKQLAREFNGIARYQDAVHMYTEAISRNPSNASFYRERGDCHIKLQNIDLAVSDYMEGLLLNPKNKNDRNHLCKVLVDFKKYNEAIKEVNHERQIGFYLFEVMSVSDDVDLAKLGYLFLHHHRLEEALRCFAEASRKNPRNKVHYEEQGLCNWRLKHFDRAILNFKKSLQLEPIDVKIRFKLCEVLIDATKYDEAKEVLQHILNMHKYGNISSSLSDRVRDAYERIAKIENEEEIFIKRLSVLKSQNDRLTDDVED